MSEYELATLAIREATLWVTVGQIFATVAIGLGQIAVVWFGIHSMQKAGDRRANEQDQRHAEAMRALDVLIADGNSQRRALETLIERTRPVD